MVVCCAARVGLPDAIQPAVAAAIFVWISVFNVLVVSVFWSLLADLLSPEAGRRTFGFVTSGATIGALGRRLGQDATRATDARDG